MPAIRWARAALALAAPLAAQVELTPLDCSQEALLRSQNSDRPVTVQFVNLTSQPVKVFWRDFQGQRVLYQVVGLASDYSQGTFVTHPWIITDTNDQCIVGFLPATFPGVARITNRTMLLSQSGFTFKAVAGVAAALGQSFQVFGAGGALHWSLTRSTLSGGANWLSVSPISGPSDSTRPPPVTVRVNAAGLAAGDYYGLISVTAPEASNAPQFVTVVLNVGPAEANPGPVVEPTGLVFVNVPGGANPGAQSVRLVNVLNRPLSFNAAASFPGGTAWFTHQPATGTIAAGQGAVINVQPNLTGRAAGVYRAELSIQFGDNSTRKIDLLLVVAAGATARLASGRVTQAGCAATRLLPVFTMLGANFNVAAGWPSAMEVLVVDDCGTPATTGSVVASFSNNDPPLALTSLLDGRWSGTWPPRNPRSTDLVVTVRAEQPDRRLEGAAQIGGGVQANPNVPLIYSGGVVSAASYAPRLPSAPGSFVAVFGSGFSDGVDVSPRLPLETRLRGTEVVAGGRSLPLLFASDGQINAVVPYSLAVHGRHQMIVRRGNSLSVPEPLTVAPAQPGIFTVDLSGRGQGHIYRATTAGEQILADAASPVTAGDVIVIYCAGLGPVDPPLEAGSAAPATVLTRIGGPSALTIGGRTATILFAGLTPGFAGLYQVNATVPEGVAPTGQVPVVLTVAGQQSPPVTIAVR